MQVSLPRTRIEGLRIDDVVLPGVLHVQATGAVALLAADVPLGHLLGLHVVVDGVAAVTGRSGRAIEVGGSIERDPPIGTGLDMVREPTFFFDVPLGWEGIEVVSPFGEEPLLPAASVDEGYLLEGKGTERSGWRNSARTASGCSRGFRMTLAMRVCFQPL